MIYIHNPSIHTLTFCTSFCLVLFSSTIEYAISRVIVTIDIGKKIIENVW